MNRRLIAPLALLVFASHCHAQKRAIHTAEQPLSPDDAAASMGVPEGFRVTLFAGEPDVMQPIGFCIDDRGRLWVAEAYNYPNHSAEPGDRVIILEDTDGDGRHDKRTVFCEGLNYVTGIEVGFGGAWVMSPPKMYFIPDRDQDDVPDRDPEVVLDGFGNHANAHNLANGFAWGPDGWLYATHGRTNWSMIGKPGSNQDQRRRFDGGVWRYHVVRDVWEPYADGTTNPWGIDWNDHGDAFVCNCVNPHLFQVIQGAHYEPWRNRESSRHAYQRIDTIADHLHFVGLGNIRDGLGSDAEDNAGGGHAHCGTMIYLGDNFPDQYRNQLFTNNIHGRRINNDLLRPSGSGYVASHGPDLMRSKDPWFMGVTLASGPGGEVYVSDWSDTGECHSTRNTRRQSGRIYRLTYLKTELERVDLRREPTDQLVELQLHANDWFVRHARRLLHERAAAGAEMTAANQRLEEILHQHSDVTRRLRALWALRVTGGTSDQLLTRLLDDPHESIRRWAINFLCEDGAPPADAAKRMTRIAADGPSPRVRLALASALQRLNPADRWPLAEALAGRGEDSEDQNLPLMIWYGVEPLLEDDLARLAKLAATASIPRVRENIARRIASVSDPAAGLELLVVTLCDERFAPSHHDIVGGILIGLSGVRRTQMPPSWPLAYSKLRRRDDTKLRQSAIRLALIFHDQDAIESLLQTSVDRSADRDFRRQAIDALVTGKIGGFGSQLLSLLDDDDVRPAVLRGLSRFEAEETADAIIKRYPRFTAEEKQIALQTLSTRDAWAKPLIKAMAAGQIPPSDVTAYTVRQLRSLDNDDVTSQLSELWGNVRNTPGDRDKQIEKLRKTLTTDVLGKADLARGEKLFDKHCGNCHRFFGKGGQLGPDLTGAQRTNLRYLLENIIDPSGSVAKAYRMHVVQTIDGRVISGLLVGEAERAITIASATDRLVIPRDEIEFEKQSNVSVMPSDLLQPMSEREIRDLIGYLQK